MEREFMQYFGIKLKQLRHARDLTQQQVADYVGVTRATIGAYETGAQYPSVESLIKLTVLLHTSADYLLGITDEQQRFDISRLTDEQASVISQLIDQFHFLNSQMKR